MRQDEVNFETHSFIFANEYKELGEPTLYYEFNKSEYYGLVVVQGGKGPFWKRAIQEYTKTVIGEDHESIVESYPTQISKSEALLKFLLADDMRGCTVNDLVEEFEIIKNGMVLIDRNLI